MKKLLSIILAINILLTAAPIAAARSGKVVAPESTDYILNEIIITQKLSSAEPLPLKKAEILDTSSTLDADERIIKGTVEYGTDIQKLCEELKKRDDIISADPNYIQTASEIELPSEVSKTGSDYNAFNWYKTSLSLPDAWQSADTLGSEDVVVAVIDTGVNSTHKEFEGAMWDDGEGHCGYNSHDDNYDISDKDGHGSNVAGIIAMRSNNFGYVGIAPNVKLMALKASSTTSFTDSDIIKCINYAIENGADIINMSFGSSFLSSSMATVYQNAARKAVLVAAAGNSSLDAELIPQYPAACSGVLGVMSYGSYKNGDRTNYTIDSGELSSFSNYDKTGQYYQLAAPGVEIAGPAPDSNTGFTFKSGTSQASPIVAGAAALYLSVHPEANPYQVRTALINGSASQITGYYNGGEYKKINLSAVLNEEPCSDEKVTLSPAAQDILNTCFDEEISEPHISDLEALTIIPQSVMLSHQDNISAVGELKFTQIIELNNLSAENGDFEFFKTAQFPRLWKLSISDNRDLSKIEFSDNTAPLLKELYADNCALDSTDGFENLKNLDTLSLSGNGFYTSYQFEKLKYVSYLDLSSCLLQDTRAFAEFENLISLDVSYNCITDISPLASFCGAYLNVSGNPLSLGVRQDFYIKSIEKSVNNNPYGYSSISFVHDDLNAQGGGYIAAKSISLPDTEAARSDEKAILKARILPLDADVNTVCLYYTDESTVKLNAFTGEAVWDNEDIDSTQNIEIKVSPVSGFSQFYGSLKILAPEVTDFSYSDGEFSLKTNIAAESVKIGETVLTDYTLSGNEHIFTVPENIEFDSALLAVPSDSLGEGTPFLINSALPQSQDQAKILSFTCDQESYFTGESAKIQILANDACNYIKIKDCVYNKELILSRYTQTEGGRLFELESPLSSPKTHKFKAYASADGNFSIGAKVLTFTVKQAPLDIKLSSKSGSKLYFSNGCDSLELDCTLYPDNADKNTQISFTSSDKTVAEVDENGKVTAIGYGESIIEAKTDNGLSTYFPVVVCAPDMTKPEVSEGYYNEESYIELYTNGASNIVLKNTDLSDVNFEYECERSESNLDGYDSCWLVTLYTITPQKLNLKVFAADDNGVNEKTAFRTISLEPIVPVESFEFEQSSYTFDRNEGAVKISLNVMPENSNEYFSWSLSSNTVASIKAYSDYVILTPKSSGTVKLSASIEINGQESYKSVNVTFTEGKIYSAEPETYEPELYKEFNVCVTTDKTVKYIHLYDVTNSLSLEYSDSCFFEDSSDKRIWNVPFYFENDSTQLRVWGGDTIGNLTSALYIDIETKTPEKNYAANPPAVYGTADEQINFGLISLPSKTNIAYSDYSVTIDDEEIASFSLGILKLKKAGSTIMHCVYNGEDTEVKINVYSPIEKIILPADSLILNEGEGYILTPQTQPESDETLYFESDNEEVAEVDENGVITAKNAGNATVYVRSKNDITASLNVKVKADDDITSLSFDKEKYEIGAGETLEYSLISNTQKLSNRVSFYSSNTNILDVDDNGCFTAKKAGTVTISAISDNGISASAQVEVLADRQLYLSRSYAITTVKNVVYFSVLATSSAIDIDGFWLTDNEQIAVVSQKGVVSAKSVGTCNIFFVSDKSEVLSCILQVNPVNISRLVINEDEVNMNIYENHIISYSKSQTFASENPSWQSADESVATVDENGVIYATGEGSTLITAVLSNGKTYSLTVNVSADKYSLSGKINCSAQIELQNLWSSASDYEIEENFEIADVSNDTYTISISALHHTSLTIEDALIDGDINLGELKIYNGDANGDGVIDIADISLILKDGVYNCSTGQAGAQADIDDDGVISVLDIGEILLAENYGKSDETIIF